MASFEEVLQLSDSIAIMYEGEFLVTGRTEELILEETELLKGELIGWLINSSAKSEVKHKLRDL